MTPKDLLKELEDLETRIRVARHNAPKGEWHNFNIQLIHIQNAIMSLGWVKTLNKNLEK